MLFRRKYKVLLALTVIACVILILQYYFAKRDIIINYPVATTPILEEIATLDVNYKFDPTYRGTTNACIVPHPNKNNYVVALHRDLNQSTPEYKTNLYVFEIDNHFKSTVPHRIELQDHYDLNNLISTAQDPRLFYSKDKLYMLYNDAIENQKRTVFISDVSLTQQGVVLGNVKNLNYSAKQYRWDEKNWTPFTYDNQIYFIYSLDPHRILHWDPKTNNVTSAFENGKALALKWPLGELRGGTPALYVKELDAYLTFFHSSLRYRKKDIYEYGVYNPRPRIYYIGALLFASKPPFKILAYTSKPLSYPGQYQNLDLRYHIIFPTGLIEEENSFLISAGIQDSKTVIFRVDKQKLYKNFVYLNNEMINEKTATQSL